MTRVIPFIVFCVLFFCEKSFSQKSKEFAPVGAEWTYDWYDGWNAASIYEKVISEYKSNDSIFKITERREATTLQFERVADRKLLVLGDSIFEFHDGQYRFIFSNAFTVGDTIQMEAWNSPQSKSMVSVVIDSSGNQIVNLDTIKLTYTSTYDFSFKYGRSRYFYQFGDKNGKIYHNIGPDASRLYDDSSPADGAARPRLMCYTEDSFSLFQSSTSCLMQYRTIVGLQKQLAFNEQLSLYPNPASDFIVVHSEKYQPLEIDIYNNIGALVDSFKTREAHPINISDLPSGIYTVRAIDENKKSTFIKFQIIR